MKIFVSIVMMLFVISCNGISNTNAQKTSTLEKVEYIEERRLNKNVDSKDVFVLDNMDDITAFYTKLQNPGITRQAPIPALEEGESLLVIKPKTNATTPYTDIEVTSLTTKGTQLVVNYKEIENLEYTENKQSHPILILKIKNKPKSVILEKVK